MEKPTQEMWQEGLQLLRELHAVGIKILCDAQHPYFSEQDHWDEMEFYWKKFQAMDPYLKKGFVPDEPQLREDFFNYLKANQDLLKVLSTHCLSTKDQLGKRLVQARAWSTHKAQENKTTQTLGKV